MNNITKHIGKVLLCAGLPLGSLAGGLTACSDYLEVEPQNIVTLDKFWNEEQDVVSSIAGVYAGLTSTEVLSRLIVWGEYRSENVLNRGEIKDDRNLELVLKEDITPTNGYTDWSHVYNVINRCNIIIHYAPKVQEKDPGYSKGELNAHIAEATAIRSLCYFYLIRTFRDVPYSEEAFINDAQEMKLPQTDFYEVLHNCIRSLEEVQDLAVVYYPVTKPKYQTARITQLAIQAMLCEMYLWDKQYDKCIEYADKIINFKKQYAKEKNVIEVDYSPYYNYPLYRAQYMSGLSYYGYGYSQIFVANNSLESIFELSFVKDGDKNTFSNTPVGLFYGGSSHTGFVQASEYIQGQVKSSTSTLYLSNKYDGRRYENFLFNAGGEVQGINKLTTQSEMELINPGTSNFYNNGTWGITYPVYKDKDNKWVSENRSSWIIYRLTDIMLLKAEAEAWKLQSSAAATDDEQTETPAVDESARWTIFHLCNAVYKRALYEESLRDTLKYEDYDTPSKLLNLVYDERQRELMFEGKRFYDLVRRAMFEGNTDYLRSKASQKSTTLAATIDNFMGRMEAIFWPVNLDEMKANPNLKQNPAYGSGENSSYKKS